MPHLTVMSGIYSLYIVQILRHSAVSQRTQVSFFPVTCYSFVVLRKTCSKNFSLASAKSHTCSKNFSLASAKSHFTLNMCIFKPST